VDVFFLNTAGLIYVSGLPLGRHFVWLSDYLY